MSDFHLYQSKKTVLLRYALSGSRLICIPFEGTTEQALQFARSLGAVVAIASEVKA